MFDFFKKKEEIEEYNIICPKCMIKMDKTMKGGIILDVCKTCGGTWFDKDEVEKVFNYMKVEETSMKDVNAPLKQPSNLVNKVKLKK